MSQHQVSLPVQPAANGNAKVATAHRGSRILVVDDERLIRWFLQEGLSNAGYEVCEAGDARTALDQFAPGRPAIDLVLTDLRLPDCSDLRLLQSLVRLAPTVPIVLMTAFGTRELCHEALRLGASGVLQKPFNVDDAVSLVRDLLPPPAPPC